MKIFSAPFSVAARLLWVTFVLWLSACREQSGEAETGETDPTVTASTEEQASVTEWVVLEEQETPADEISELRREIEARQQTVEDLQAAVEMERAKVEVDPNYDTSFLLEVQEEQQELRQAIETDTTRLEELTDPEE